ERERELQLLADAARRADAVGQRRADPGVDQAGDVVDVLALHLDAGAVELGLDRLARRHGRSLWVDPLEQLVDDRAAHERGQRPAWTRLVRQRGGERQAELVVATDGRELEEVGRRGVGPNLVAAGGRHELADRGVGRRLAPGRLAQACDALEVEAVAAARVLL